MSIQDATMIVRCTLIAVLASGVTSFFPGIVFAGDAIGVVAELRGSVRRVGETVNETLDVGAPVFEHDLVSTGTHSFVTLVLRDKTRVIMGPDTKLVIDSFIAEQGGDVEITSGQMVFDRDENTPPINATVRTVFGMIGVRG